MSTETNTPIVEDAIKSPIHDLLASSGAEMGVHDGVITAVDFGDVRSEFKALTEGYALYDLGWRAKIIVSGEDRQRWLNGMVTNSIKDLPLNRGNYSFLLDAKGHILGDLYVYNRGQYLIVDTARAQAAKIVKTLEHFIIMDDVELKDASDTLSAIGVQGARAGAALEAAGLTVPRLEALQLADITWQNTGLSIARMAGTELETGSEIYEIWGLATNLARLWTSLAAGGATLVGSDALERFRVTMGVPRYGTDIRERDLPQETGQKHALNFTKGCYIGQEIVERIRSRGNVHRKFTGFTFTGEAPVAGMKLQLSGKDVGEITSVAKIPMKGAGERVVALGYIRREAAEKAEPVLYPGGEAKIANLPFSYE